MRKNLTHLQPVLLGKDSGKLQNAIVVALWSAVLLGICIRIGLVSRDHDVFATYADAGRKWTNSQPLYTYTRGFVYSPLIAALFAPFSWFPNWLGGILWRLLTSSVFLAAIFLWLKEGLHRGIARSRYWLVFLFILPLSLGNFNNGQVNPLITGLLMIAIVAAHRRQWTLSAVCLGLTAYLKIYPLSVGLLLVLLYPRELGWRLLVTLLLMGVLAFLLQRPNYVLEQYQRWFGTRAADDRRMNMDIAPRDFAMLLKALHINLSSQIFLVLQLLAGIGTAAGCIYGRIRNWSEDRLLVGLFTLGTCWMLLFGPSTEDATYAMIAPPLALAAVQAFGQKSLGWMGGLVCSSYAVLLIGLVLNAFFSLKKTPYTMSVQPLGALMFLVFAAIWILSSSLWEHAGKEPGEMG
jgi:glycosyl transferase family 87